MKLKASGAATPREAPLRLDDYLPYRLSVLTNTISNTLARGYADRFGLSVAQWRVLAALGDESAGSANEVVAKTRMDKVTVSRAVAGLVQGGRLLRRRDPEDGRRSLLRLSAKGRAIYERIVPIARRYEAELLERLDPGERAALDRLIGHLDEVALSLATAGRTEGMEEAPEA